MRMATAGWVVKMVLLRFPTGARIQPGDYSCDTVINNLSTPKLCGTLSLIKWMESISRYPQPSGFAVVLAGCF